MALKLILTLREKIQMNEKEFVYEVGLSNDDKERLSKELGVHCLSLEDYADVKQQIEGIATWE